MNFLYFLPYSVNLLGIFTSKKKLIAFERNSSFLGQLFDALEINQNFKLEITLNYFLELWLPLI